jgi:threonine aldolase
MYALASTLAASSRRLSIRPFVRCFTRPTHVADFRSDTVTKPTAAMTIAMFDAEVGDDVYNEDPSVTKLEKHVAELLGKQAALFTPTATMSNLLAVGAHCARGEEVFCGSESHLFIYEQGGASWLSA